MVRMKSTAVLICLALSPLFALVLGPLNGQQPVTPPGPVQVIVPPGPAPTPAPPDTEPAPDDLVSEPDFEITATVGGEVIADPVVALPAERMLTLVVVGKAVSGEQKPVVTWSLNRPSADISIEYDGHKVNFCGPNGSVWLFQAAVNSVDPKAGPFVAQRWVVVGMAPQPPPVVDPPVVVPPNPPTPPVTTGGLHSLILIDRESERNLPKETKAAYESPKVIAYLATHTAKDHAGIYYGRIWDDSFTADQITDDPLMEEAYFKAITASGGKRPWLYAWNATTLVSKSFANEAELMALLKPLGGE